MLAFILEITEKKVIYKDLVEKNISVCP